MATVVIKSLSVCAGGNHYTAVVSIDGGKDESVPFTKQELDAIASTDVRTAIVERLKVEVLDADAKDHAAIVTAIEGKTLKVAADVKVAEVADVEAEADIEPTEGGK